MARARQPKAPTPSFGKVGTDLWKRLHTGRSFDPAGDLLVTEACRIADRLNQLDALLRGDIPTWAEITEGRGGQLVLQVDSALAEARQQAGQLRAIFATLGVGTSSDAQQTGRSALDDLAARRAARGAATSDSVRPAHQ
jgi:hypothetical protein